jgi:hypothetical protein
MRQLVFGTVALLALVQASAPLARASCAGADPAIVSVAVSGVTSDGKVNRYLVKGNVVNVGRRKQASNVLQFVDIFQNDIKLDAKSIPPLKPRQSFTFSFVFQRSTDAGTGTSDLVFQLDMRNPSPAGSQNCDAANDRRTLTF